MISNFFDEMLKNSDVSKSDIKVLKVVYTIFGILVLYLCICMMAYGLGYLVAKLELFYNK